jgi:hypothetical protein
MSRTQCRDCRDNAELAAEENVMGTYYGDNPTDAQRTEILAQRLGLMTDPEQMDELACPAHL